MTRRLTPTMALLMTLGCQASGEADPERASKAAAESEPAAQADALEPAKSEPTEPAAAEPDAEAPLALPPKPPIDKTQDEADDDEQDEDEPEPIPPLPELTGPSRFHLVAQLSPDDRKLESYELPAMRMFETIDGSLFVAGGPLALRVTGNEIPEPTPEALRGVKPLVSEEIEHELYGFFGWRVQYLGGRWPDGLYMTTVWNTEFPDIPDDPYELHHWDTDHWTFTETRSGKLSYHIERTAPWKNDQILGLRRHSLYLPEANEETYDDYVGEAHPLIDKARKLVVLHGPDRGPTSLSKRMLVDFDALPDGTIIALEGKTTALKYDAATDKLSKSTLPGGDVHYARIELVDAAHGWAWTSGYASSGDKPMLAFYDGSSWKAEQLPSCGGDPNGYPLGIANFAVAPSGRQWLACGIPPDRDGFYEGTSLWTRAPGEAWTREALPAKSGAINQIIARGPNDVWIASDVAVLHTKAPAKVVTMPSMKRMWIDAIAYRDPVTSGGKCSSYTVLLKAKLDGDYVDELDALKTAIGDAGSDTAFGVGSFRGRKHLLLTFGLGDWAHELADTLRAKAGPLIEDIYCAYPDDFDDYEML